VKGKRDEFQVIYNSLADATRREILEWLKAPEASFPNQGVPTIHGVSAGEIRKKTSLAQSTVSVHLKILRKAGLVKSKRLGKMVLFSRDEETVHRFLASLSRDLW
jgi:DNA-binding transcriptional ArsR family regulator